MSNKHYLSITLCSANVNGNYSDWGEWSSCSVTCGGGTRTRNRTCTNPIPQENGKNCSGLGSAVDNEFCQNQSCTMRK
jgi:hypothetical protein